MLTIDAKIFSALMILFMALSVGFFPVLYKASDRAKRGFLYGESFAGGIFLGAGLIHLLPDAMENFHHVYAGDYPIVMVICALSILFLRIVEEGALKLFQHRHSTHQVCMACILTIVLSVHSILAGAALGVETEMASFVIILTAILAHKGSAAFALGINLKKSEMPVSAMSVLMILFSIMTPIGILFGSFLSLFFHEQNGYLAIGIFNAIAAGTFIYIAAFHSVRMNDEKNIPVLKRLMFFTLGLIIMAVVAVWL